MKNEELTINNYQLTMKNNAARLLLLHMLNLTHSRCKDTYNIINYQIYYKIFFKINDFFFIRAQHDLNFHNLRSKFLIVAQQLLNCQSSIVNKVRLIRIEGALELEEAEIFAHFAQHIHLLSARNKVGRSCCRRGAFQLIAINRCGGFTC